MADPTYEQEAFQFLWDDGTEAGATLRGAVNSNQIYKPGQHRRLRIRLEVNNDNNRADTNTVFDWERSLNSGTWTAITGSSSVVQAVASAAPSPPSNGDDCTQRIGDGDFITDNDGWTSDGSITVPTFARGDNIETELCCYIIPGDVQEGNTIEFRVVSNAGYTVTYTVTPLLTVLKRRPAIGHI